MLYWKMQICTEFNVTELGWLEFAGVENDGPSKNGGRGGIWGLENDGLENDGVE